MSQISWPVFSSSSSSFDCLARIGAFPARLPPRAGRLPRATLRGCDEPSDELSPLNAPVDEPDANAPLDEPDANAPFDADANAPLDANKAVDEPVRAPLNEPLEEPVDATLKEPVDATFEALDTNEPGATALLPDGRVKEWALNPAKAALGISNFFFIAPRGQFVAAPAEVETYTFWDEKTT